MYKILIVDDELLSRENAKSALIQVPKNRLFQEKRMDLADEYFQIKEFAIAGEAINHIQSLDENSKYDLALIDISFAKLTNDYVKEKGFDPKVEINPTRGFAVYDVIENHTQPIIFSAYANVHDAIGEELLNRRQLKYVNILSKATGINLFSIPIAENLQIIANQLIANANDVDFTQLLPLLQAEEKNLDAIIPCWFKLDGRRFSVKEFFIFKFHLDEKGQNLVPDDDFLDYVLNVFERFVVPEVVEEIVQPQQNVELLRSWNHDWVKKAIDAFKQVNINNDLDISTANCILEFLQVSHQNLRKIRNARHQNHWSIIRRAAIGKKEKIYGQDLAWTNTFHNALISRRTFLALSVLADEQIWANNFRTRNNNIFDFIMDKAGWENDGGNNIRHHFNTRLGLAIDKDLHQRFNLLQILPEEQQFLDTYVPLILNRMNIMNMNQPNPDYNPFA